MTVACWILAHTWETFSKSIDWRVMLFFYYSFLVINTPSGASILLFILNPKKFLISTVCNKRKNYSAVVSDVNDDWEMGVCQDHLELVSVGDTVDHVSNGWSDGTEDGVSLFLLKPHSEFDGWVALFVLIFNHFERNVSEGFGEGTEFTLDNDLSWLDINGDSFGDF